MSNNNEVKETDGRNGRKVFWSRGRTAFLVIALSLIFYFILLRWGSIFSVIKKIFKILAPVWYGFIIAYLNNPLMKRVEKRTRAFLDRKEWMTEAKRRKFSRGFGIFVALAVGILIVGVLLDMVMPELYKSLRRLIIVLPEQLNSIVTYIEGLQSDSMVGTLGKDLIEKANSAFQNWFTGDFWNQINDVMNNVTTRIINFATTLMNIFIGVIVSVYVLNGKEKFAGQGKKILYSINKPERANFVLHILHKSNMIFGGFLIGKLIDSLIIGIMCYFGLRIFHITASYTILVSVIVGVTNIIPFFGPYIGAIPSAFLIFLESPIKCVYFVIFILCLQQFDGNILGPKILGDSTGLSAFWVVVSILLGGGLFGFLGMVFGVPTFAVIYYIVKMLVNEKLRKKNMSMETTDYVDINGLNMDKMEFTYYSEEDKNGSSVKNSFSRIFRKKSVKTENDKKKPETFEDIMKDNK